MKKIILLLALCLSFKIACADTLKVGDTDITFSPPRGFDKVSQDIINAKWRNRDAPQFVVGNEQATTTIAYDLKPHKLPQDKLSEVQASFKALFDRVIPGIRWVKNEIRELAGQKWVFFELMSNAADTDIHNMMLVTGYQDRMLIFNFNSTKSDFPKYEKELRQSIETIKIP